MLLRCGFVRLKGAKFGIKMKGLKWNKPNKICKKTNKKPRNQKHPSALESLDNRMAKENRKNKLKREKKKKRKKITITDHHSSFIVGIPWGHLRLTNSSSKKKPLPITRNSDPWNS